MEFLFEPHNLVALLTLTLLEIVLGIDNIIFLSLVINNIPKEKRRIARVIGLGLALGMRIILLLFLTSIIGLTEPLFTLFDQGFSGRDLILAAGGLFLMTKSTLEIHSSLEGKREKAEQNLWSNSFAVIVVQIILIDLVFSFDSILTAVGLVEEVLIMIIAVVIAMFIMLFASKSIGDIIDKHPTLKMLALSFLILIGMVLIADGFGFHIDRGYIYFAMAFATSVEALNIKLRKHLHRKLD